MLKRIFSLVMIGALLIVTGGRFALAADARAKEAVFTAKLKAEIAKLGTGPSAQVQITLRDKSKFKGYIREANEDYFLLVDEKTGALTEIAYPQVKQVKGNNLSTGAKVAIGVGIGFVVLLLLLKGRIDSH
jgi:hypothetical protein